MINLKDLRTEYFYLWNSVRNKNVPVVFLKMDQGKVKMMQLYNLSIFRLHPKRAIKELTLCDIKVASKYLRKQVNLLKKVIGKKGGYSFKDSRLELADCEKGLLN